MERPKLKRDWKGLQVKTLRSLKNGYIRIPAGTVCVVRENYAGLRLEGPACEHCGVSIFISKVSEHDVVIIGKGQSKSVTP